MPLVLRHANHRRLGTCGPGDYDVLNGSGGVVGRIMKPQAAATSDTPWEWAITGLRRGADRAELRLCADQA